MRSTAYRKSMNAFYSCYSAANLAATIAPMQCAPKVTALSVKLPIVSLRFTQRHSKAPNGDASKLHRLKFYYPRPAPSPEVRPNLRLCVYSLVWMCVSMLDPHRACISYCANVGLPQSLNFRLCECVFPCWTPAELVYPRVNVCFHAGLPQSLLVIRLY